MDPQITQFLVAVSMLAAGDRARTPGNVHYLD